jgi:hypothetical protein
MSGEKKGDDGKETKAVSESVQTTTEKNSDKQSNAYTRALDVLESAGIAPTKHHLNLMAAFDGNTPCQQSLIETWKGQTAVKQTGAKPRSTPRVDVTESASGAEVDESAARKKRFEEADKIASRR